MVKKSSSKDKANTQSTQADDSAKSEQLESGSKSAVKKTRKATEEKGLPESAASMTKPASDKETAPPKVAASPRTQVEQSEKKIVPPSEKATPQIKTEQTENKVMSAEKNTPEVKIKQEENSIASAASEKTEQLNAGQDEKQAAPAAEKPIAETLGESGKNESPQPVNPITIEPQEATIAVAAKDNAETVEPVYLEPETPLILAPSEVEEAESVNPPIPEEMRPAGENYSISEQADVVHHYEHPGPQYPSMFVVQITPELAPLAKVGGLADVVTGLSRELELRGNSVEIILPKYDCMRYDHIWGLCKTFDDLWVPWYGGHIQCTVWFGFVHGRKCFFIEPHSQDRFFNRGSIYGFDDDILRFAFFSRAAVEFLLKSGKRPEIIHCHDWQTALVPVYLYEIYKHMGMTHPRVCFTIHNFKHQGITGDFMLRATGLHRPEYYFHRDRLLDNHIPHALNLMKGGIVYSNFVTTVSPRYAGETKDGGQGFGLEPTLHTHHYKYGGIVNGIDYDAWNPEIDPHIPVHYNVNTIEGKYGNKHALRNRLLLADNAKPIIAFVGRLDPQKGLDLVRHALFYALNHAAQFVLLGSSPEGSINNYFWELKRHLNDSPDCHIEVGFDEELAHLIYAGADMIIVPSLFEPCGLTQLIAMQYGTIPIVRAVGGLADTVFDKDYAHEKPLHERNGYVFKDYNNAGIESALSRAIGCYYEFPDHFRELMKNAMRYDYSWKYAGQHYLNIYDYIRDK